MKDTQQNPVPEHDDRPAPDEVIRKPGERVLLSTFAEMPDGDPACLDVGHIIITQMGLFAHQNDAIRSAWAVWGKHRAGGALLILDTAKTKENGDMFIVSYNLRTDEYTISYAKRMQELPDGQPEETTIIEEIGMMQCGDLCRVFSDMTGIEIPVVAFD